MNTYFITQAESPTLAHCANKFSSASVHTRSTVAVQPYKESIIKTCKPWLSYLYSKCPDKEKMKYEANFLMFAPMFESVTSQQNVCMLNYHKNNRNRPATHNAFNRKCTFSPKKKKKTPQKQVGIKTRSLVSNYSWLFTPSIHCNAFPLVVKL